jgi:hypothetical protein
MLDDELERKRRVLCVPVSIDAEKRTQLGRMVRDVWIRWSLDQPDVEDHPSWLVPWDELSERDREVDMRIGESIYVYGYLSCKRDK